MKRPEVERMRALLVEAITTLCRSGLPYSDNLKVEGLIGITLDEADIILVNLNKTFGHGMGEIPSLEKYQKDRDRATLSDEEASRDSTGDAMSPQGTRKKERRKRRRNSGAFTDGKRPLRDSGTNQDSETEQQIQVLNTFSVASPEKPTNRTNRRSTDFDTVPSASSEESALTVHDKRSASLQDNQESNENKDSAPAPETVVKIEIDSDQDIEEVKVEPSPSASCSRVPALPNYQQQGSLSDSFPPDLSQSMPSLSASDIQGELYSSQLPPELSAVASSESGPVPVGMFSSPVSHSSPIAGPSGLNMPTVGSSLYSQSPGGGQLGAIQQRNKHMGPSYVMSRKPVQSYNAYATGSQVDLTQGDGVSNRTMKSDKYKCKYCGKVFASSSGKFDHEGTHEGKYRYQCTICGKGFMATVNLEGHMNKHRNHRPYKCLFCDRTFAYKNARDRHLRVCKESDVTIESQGGRSAGSENHDANK